MIALFIWDEHEHGKMRTGH